MKMGIALSTLASVILASAAFADSHIVYSVNRSDSSYERPNARIYGSVEFPGYGEVASDLVCLNSSKGVFQTTMAAHREYVCDSSIIDRSDSTRPVVRCVSGHWTSVPAQVLDAPLSLTKRECVNSVVDHTDSTRPVTTCLEWADVTLAQDLRYELVQYQLSDYRKENPIATVKMTIGSCQ